MTSPSVPGHGTQKIPFHAVDMVFAVGDPETTAVISWYVTAEHPGAAVAEMCQRLFDEGAGTGFASTDLIQIVATVRHAPVRDNLLAARPGGVMASRRVAPRRGFTEG